MMFAVLFAAAYLAFNNGANDNFKGFATVWGAESLSYRRALALATIATVAGGLASVLLANGLAQQFSGKGLVPDALVVSPAFALAVAGGAAATVGLATRFGFPISTTHALIGGLVGAGIGFGASVDAGRLGSAFFLPLLFSPIVSATLGYVAYRVYHARRRAAADCACVVETVEAVGTGTFALQASTMTIITAESAACDADPSVVARVDGTTARDALHVFSAATICFARGLNDTPKLAALFIIGGMLGAAGSVLGVVAAMAIGGILLSRRVAETMSRKITSLDPEQGISASIITAGLVLAASKFGMPVSTTHVSVGSIIGVGASAHTAHWPVIRGVLASWLLTLPIAATCAAAIALLIT